MEATPPHSCCASHRPSSLGCRQDTSAWDQHVFARALAPSSGSEVCTETEKLGCIDRDEQMRSTRHLRRPMPARSINEHCRRFPATSKKWKRRAHSLMEWWRLL